MGTQFVRDEKIETLLNLAWQEAVRRDPVCVAQNLASKDIAAEARNFIQEAVQAGRANEVIVEEVIVKILLAWGNARAIH